MLHHLVSYGPQPGLRRSVIRSAQNVGMRSIPALKWAPLSVGIALGMILGGACKGQPSGFGAPSASALSHDHLNAHASASPSTAQSTAGPGALESLRVTPRLRSVSQRDLAALVGLDIKVSGTVEG